MPLHLSSLFFSDCIQFSGYSIHWSFNFNYYVFHSYKLCLVGIFQVYLLSAQIFKLPSYIAECILQLFSFWCPINPVSGALANLFPLCVCVCLLVRLFVFLLVLSVLMPSFLVCFVIIFYYLFIYLLSAAHFPWIFIFGNSERTALQQDSPRIQLVMWASPKLRTL